MPAFSAFTGFGFFEFSSEPSEHEKAYNALVASYIDPRTGRPAIDIDVGTHQEATIYGWAGALGGARVHLRRAANDLRAETSYATLTAHEAKHRMSPAATDTVPMRQAALAAKQKSARGPRYEAVWEALGAIFGSDLIAYRPMTTAEAEAYPVDPAAHDSAGLFRRSDAVATSVRLLDAITRTGGPYNLIDWYVEANQNDVASLRVDFKPAVAQTFRSLQDAPLSSAHFFLQKTGAPTGTAVVKLYAYSGAIGDTSIPSGAALATSAPLDVSTLTGSYALTEFLFHGVGQAMLTASAWYALAIEVSGGSVGNTVDVGMDTSGGASHGGNSSFYNGSVWTPDGIFSDLVFYVRAGYAFEVSYENWNRSLVEARIVAGDVVVVDQGNLGLAEKVHVLAAAGEGTSRTFTAVFRKPHDASTYATTGPAPLWSNTKRHVLVVVKAAAAVDRVTIAKVNDLFRRIMRGPTTWAIVQPTTPGATTVGPFKIGSTTGSPLGAVPLEALDIAAAPACATSFAALFGSTLAHLWDSYDFGTATMTDSVGALHANTLSGSGPAVAPPQATQNGHTYPVFDGGVASNGLAAASMTDLNGLASYTIFFAFKTNAGSAYGAIFDHAQQVYNELVFGGGLLLAGGYGGGAVDVYSAAINDDLWHRCVVTVNANVARLYVDGVLQGSGVFPTATAVNPTLIGVQPGGTVTDSGVLVVGIATRGLTPAEAACLDEILTAYVGP